jgi:2-oxoglutarate ferredoxin oxidoreductase subunit alpha
MQSIFRMGIPVSGKNIFPSNIQGFPTWYEIRVSRDGYTARPPELDLVVALNTSTYGKDIAAVRPGGYLLYDSSWPLEQALLRDGITMLGIPFGKMCVEAFERDRDRTLLRNIAYAGALAALLEIDMDIIHEALKEKFSRKKSLLDVNFTAIRLGFDYVKANFECPLPFRLERMNANADYVLMDGNTASALGALYAGATVGAWYPITPATSLMEAFTKFCEQYRVDPVTKEKKFCIIQAEDELAAAGIVIGANWAGARSFTSTSGPGLSLMQEFIGLAYYTETPAVFFDVQRTGPSTGLPTRTQQSDLISIAYASHGDTKHIMLFPANPEECFYDAVRAFDMAERFQTPVFVVTDLDIGMNDWMVKRLKWDDGFRPDRGKVLGAEDVEKLKKFSRYIDVDGDGIAARTLPGVGPKGAWFARGSGHDKFGNYTEESAAYQEVLDRLVLKLANAAKAVPAPELNMQNGADIGIVGFGGCHAAIREAVDVLRAQGVAVDYMRIRGFPFDQPVADFINSHETVFVVEQNRDAQMRALLAIELGVPRDHMTPVLDYNGLPLTSHVVVSAVTNHLQKTGVGA